MEERALPVAVDLTRYPIHDLENADGKAVVTRCREELSRHSFLTLPGFLKAETLPALVAEAQQGGRQAIHFVEHFPFGDGTEKDRPSTAGLPADDPRRFISRTALRFIADDLIPQSSLLRDLYVWPGMANFLSAILGKERLYPRRDGLSGLNYTLMTAGDEQDWHFDEADFSATILLQSSSGGGRFEYVRGLRGPAGDDLDGLKGPSKAPTASL